MAKKTSLKARLRQGTAWNSSLRPGPWTRTGKPSKQTRARLRKDSLTSLYVRVLNASMFFSMHGEGLYPGGAEGLTWSKCQLQGCKRVGDRADHLAGRSGSRSIREDPRAMGVLCEFHNDFDKGSDNWGDYRPERFKALIERLVPEHFDHDVLRPERFDLNKKGKLWLKKLNGKL